MDGILGKTIIVKSIHCPYCGKVLNNDNAWFDRIIRYSDYYDYDKLIIQRFVCEDCDKKMDSSYRRAYTYYHKFALQKGYLDPVSANEINDIEDYLGA